MGLGETTSAGEAIGVRCGTLFAVAVLVGLAARPASADPVPVCWLYQVHSPLEGQTGVPTDLVVDVSVTQDPTCGAGSSFETGELVVEVERVSSGERVRLSPLFALANLDFVAPQPLAPSEAYRLTVTLNGNQSQRVAERNFTTGPGLAEAPTLANLTLTVETQLDTFQQEVRVAQVRIDADTPSAAPGPLRLAFGPDAAGVGAPIRGSLTSVLFVPAAEGAQSIAVILGNEEQWPYDETCVQVQALASAPPSGDCPYPGPDGCRVVAVELTTCKETPIGCSHTGTPGPLALVVSLLALLFHRRPAQRA